MTYPPGEKQNELLIRRSRRARRLSLRVEYDGSVVVVVPLRVTAKKIEQFILANTAWIRLRREEINTHRNAIAAEFTCYENLDRPAAKQRLADRCRSLAAQHGFPLRSVTIRDQRTRWGSCSSRNTISLNIKLACLPTHLADYVIYHELVHTLHKNHGRQFWDALAGFLPDAKSYRTELRKYSTLLSANNRNQ